MKAVYETLKSKFPGLMEFDSISEFNAEMHNPHSILLGEVMRATHLLRRLDQVRREKEAHKLSDEATREAQFEALHGWYADMYGLRSSELRVNATRLRQACEDVERDIDHLVGMLPRALQFDGKTWRIHDQLRGPDLVRTCNDSIELIRLWRTPIPSDPSEQLHIKEVRRRARYKLISSQFYFEQYLHEQSLGHLRERAAEARQIFRDRLFGGDHGEEVYVVAELDSLKSYTCQRWGIETSLPKREPNSDRAVIRAKRYWLKTPGERIPVYFFVRPKDHLFLKALRQTRFLELKGIGDLVGACFIVEAGHVDLLVASMRSNFVRAPGMVCDQGSRQGDRAQKPDPDNRHSSSGYKVMKYSALVRGRIIEIQFKTGEDWINDHCEHTDRNHGSYKLRQYLESVLPVIAPAIPWHEISIQKQCEEHLLSKLSRDWL